MSKITIAKRANGIAQLVEHLRSKLETLSSTSCTAKKKSKPTKNPLSHLRMLIERLKVEVWPRTSHWAREQHGSGPCALCLLQ
jgi:hypothetical protein